jgi:hypothetical protein
MSILFLIAATLVTQSAGTRANAEAPFSITIKAVQETVTSNSEVRIGVTLTNISNREISSYKVNGNGQAELGGYIVDIRTDKGNRPAETKYQRKITTGEDAPGESSVLVISGGYVPLKSGESLRDEIVATKLFDLSQPGKYEIRVTKIDEQSKIIVRSNAITVSVIP